MSYHGKYSSSGGDSSRRYSSSSRRDSSPPRHRRRSPSPGPSRGRSPVKPRDPKNLPESFGRISDSGAPDDDLNVVQRMKTSYINSPLHDLYKCVVEKKKLKIWTRNYKEVRGILTGYLIAFDKHWNLILRDVDEVYLKPKKSKTPFLRDIEPSESLPDMPPKVPRQKKTTEGEAAAAAPPAPKVKEEKEDDDKKKRRKKKSKKTSEKRAIKKLFVRGDNIVMICPLDDDETEGDDGEESQSG